MASKHIHRAAIFTIHNPTRHVRAVLDRALLAYTQAYSTVMHHFSRYSVEELHAMATIAIGDNGEQITHTQHFATSLFNRDVPCITAALAPLESSLREAFKLDIASNLMSYLELSLDPQQATPSYPERLRAQDKEPSRLEALEGLRTLSDNLEEENTLRDQLHKTKQAEYRPLSFNRIDTIRNCGLFYNPDTRQFYARLFIVPASSRHGKPITMAGRYIDVRSGEVYMRQEDAKQHEGVQSFGTGTRSVMVLLEMGEWHERMYRFTNTAFLPQRNKEAEAATPVSATLVKCGDDYRLHVMFRLPKPERVKPQALLGVDRGITCLAAGAVTSLDAKEVKETFVCDGLELRAVQKKLEEVIKIRQQKGQPTKGERRRAKIADHHVHMVANQIVELAVKHQAQVIMEDLKAFSSPQTRVKGMRRSNFAKMLPRRQYQKLQEVVNAKLALVGLPPIRTVYAAYTSITCSVCGCVSKESRSVEDRTQFVCVECKHTDHADAQAGINIARKVPYLTLRGKEKQKGIADDKRTTWETFVKRLLS